MWDHSSVACGELFNSGTSVMVELLKEVVQCIVGTQTIFHDLPFAIPSNALIFGFTKAKFPSSSN